MPRIRYNITTWIILINKLIYEMCVWEKGGYEIEKTGVFWLGDVVLVYT